MSKTSFLPQELYDYLLSVSLREPEVLRRLREETARDPMARMQISPDQGQFLMLLLKLLGARKTIEIGVYTGYSTLCAALALPADGTIVACDINEEWTSIARRYWNEASVEQKIDLCLAPAVKTLDRLLANGQAGTFDYVFIDADKENMLNYYERALQLIRIGGIIAVDNVLWSGRVIDPQVNDADTESIRAFNKKLHADSRVEMSMIPVGDGLTLLCKRG